MGRVARYKKIKAIDPFSKKNGGKRVGEVTWGLGDDGRKKKKRSYTATELRRKAKKVDGPDKYAFDLPPEKDDFDIRDMVNSLKKETIKMPQMVDERTAAPKSIVQLNIPSSHEMAVASLEEEKKTARILKISEDPKPKVEIMKRVEGESKKAFYKRVKQETRQLIRQDKLESHNPEKRQKKKEFLNAKKKAKKGKGSNKTDNDDDFDTAADNADDKNAFITGEQAAARQSSIHDQVERPPSFQQLPRGAMHKKATMLQNNKSKSNFQVALEHKAMEDMRRKVQEQYALIKAKRKQNRDFHL
jgi:hypothetical protein